MWRHPLLRERVVRVEPLLEFGPSLELLIAASVFEKISTDHDKYGGRTLLNFIEKPLLHLAYRSLLLRPKEIQIIKKTRRRFQSHAVQRWHTLVDRVEALHAPVQIAAHGAQIRSQHRIELLRLRHEVVHS